MSIDYGYLPVITSFVHCDWLQSKESVVSGMLPHQVRVVSHEPAVLHPTSQSEAKVHSNVVVQSAVVSGGVGTEWAVPVRYLPLYVQASVHKGTALFNLFLSRLG